MGAPWNRDAGRYGWCAVGCSPPAASCSVAGPHPPRRRPGRHCADRVGRRGLGGPSTRLPGAARSRCAGAGCLPHRAVAVTRARPAARRTRPAHAGRSCGRDGRHGRRSGSWRGGAGRVLAGRPRPRRTGSSSPRQRPAAARPACRAPHRRGHRPPARARPPPARTARRRCGLTTLEEGAAVAGVPPSRLRPTSWCRSTGGSRVQSISATDRRWRYVVPRPCRRVAAHRRPGVGALRAGVQYAG